MMSQIGDGPHNSVERGERVWYNGVERHIRSSCFDFFSYYLHSYFFSTFLAHLPFGCFLGWHPLS